MEAVSVAAAEGAFMQKESYYKDVREHLKALEERGKLVRVKQRINKDTELMPLEWPDPSMRLSHFGPL